MTLVRALGIDARTKFMFLLAFVALVLWGCARIPAEYRAFLELPPHQRHEEMKKFPVNKQIDYYLAGMRYMHPPQIDLADDIAQRGKQALPDLMRRLREQKDENTQFEIIYVFKVMHATYYKLNNEEEVIALLREKVVNMRDSRWKSGSEEILTFILGNRSPDLKNDVDFTN